MSEAERACSAIDDARHQVQPADLTVPVGTDREEPEEQTPYEIACDMEEPLHDIADFAEAIAMASADLQAPARGAICRLARSIIDNVQEVKGQRDVLFHALYPGRASAP